MKKLIAITLVAILLAVSVVPALAAGGPPADRGAACGSCYGNQSGYGSQTKSSYQARYSSQNGYGLRNPYALSGTITGVDAENHTVTVSIACGNRLVNPYIGQEVSLSASESTRFLLRNDDGTVTPISFDDLAIGQQISSHGSLVDGVWSASRITVGALLTCLTNQ